jgi:uncharacterized damage-inducible protein DinB
VNKTAITHMWDDFRTVNGIGLRAVATIPSDQLESHPIANMRSPKELVCHMYQILSDLTASVANGEAFDSTPAEAKAAQSIRSSEQLIAWCRERWSEAEKNVQGLTDAQIAGTVKTPWGHDFSGHAMLRILLDEYWHHRGQLYCYLRALGVAPHSIYDFEHNAPEFQPGAKATV